MKKRFLALVLALGIFLCGCQVTITFNPTPYPTFPTLPAEAETLTVHYIDVGQADCILLECNDKFMLIDGGNRDDSRLVIADLQQQGVEELEAVVCTHAHEDHVGGLPGVLAVFPAKAVYAPTKTYASKIFDDFLRYVDQQGLDITIPSPGDTFSLDETELTVLGPVKTYAEPNDTSIIITARFGETRFLFTGDMEVAAETDMLNYWGDDFDWKMDVLKAGHHGSDTSSGYRFIYETDPEYVIIPVGDNNTYGHPSKSVMSRFTDAGIPTLRTDELGHILVTTDGDTISITWQDQSAIPSGVPVGYTTYIGNKTSKKFHAPGCPNLPGESNRVEFTSYDEAIAAGYVPCGSCMG